MSKILDLIAIKIELKMSGTFLAKVTLNWADEFEVRFCRLTRRSDRSLWFQPPSLKEFGWAKCFVVIKKEEWKALEKKVIDSFLRELKEKVDLGVFNPNSLEELNNFQQKAEITEDDYQRMDKEITN